MDAKEKVINVLKKNRISFYLALVTNVTGVFIIL